jgi:hypothetical protein
MADLEIKSIKTINGYLLKLNQLGWIIYNPKTGILYVKGMDKIRQHKKFNRRMSVSLNKADILDLKVALPSASICYLSEGQKKEK